MEGRLVIIGGAEDKKGKRTILKRFLAEAGGEDAVVVVLTSATEEPEAAGETYRAVFGELGARSITALDVGSRARAYEPGVSEALSRASGIFFTGGDQLRISSIIGGTPVARALSESYRRGVVIAGTSAGASAMSEVMIVGGPGEEAPKRGPLSLAPGLGLLREVVVDQHFAQRGRIGRLLAAVAQHPGILGLGLDEDTAVLISPEATLEVVGSGAATIMDGCRLQFTNVSEQAPNEALAMAGVTLHVLPHGYRFDLKNRVVLRSLPA